MPRGEKGTTIGTELRGINRQFEEEQTKQDARRLGLEYCDVGEIVINPDLVLLVPEEDARAAELMLYYRVGDKVRVAVRNPEAPLVQEVIERLRDKGLKVNMTIASLSGLRVAWKLYGEHLVRSAQLPKSAMGDTTVGTAEEETKTLMQYREEIRKANSSDAAITILTGAVRTGASDIHLEPYGDSVRLRLRIDGVAHDVFDMDSTTAKLILDQFKQMSQMKLNVSTRPQDGRFTFHVGNRSIDARVSTLPTVEGETIVMRLLDNERQILGLEGLGLRGTALEDTLKSLQEPHGMILSTGPTGSGKTTTLYSMLSIINTPEKKVITLEDPVEYRVHGVSQSQINPSEEYSFAKGLRAILRQDPDIVMVGEIRDLETAEIAAQAAMTGHVVLATLHTNDAVSAVPRLINMGMKAFEVSPSLGTIIAQRLVRRVCESCGKSQAPSSSELKVLKESVAAMKEVNVSVSIPAEIVSPVGCEVCSHTGYHGQIGVFEVFRLNDEIKQMILDEKSTADLFKAARARGMLTMREDGMLRVIEGMTTVSEVLRVTGTGE